MITAPRESGRNGGRSGNQPNIVMIMSDDVGIWNLSAYHRGMMGGSTPNIDRIAKEGALFTDYYGQQSCTAGRAAFILGQTPFRTGLLKVGMPAAKQGLQDKDPTIAELLKPLGYATAQIGKNHLGDRNEYLPTVHGFDEFYGILYHLNAMEEPYDPSTRRIPASMPSSARATSWTPRPPTSTTRRRIRAGAGSASRPSPTAVPLPPHPNMDPAAEFNMEDVDAGAGEAVAVDFIDRSVKADKPFFLWHNSTRCHVWTHLSPKWAGKSGFGLYADAMMELDWVVGEILGKLDELGIADDTIVLFTSDNGAEIFSWPDGGNHPFRGEKGTVFEGGFRVPMLAKWPGVIKPGTSSTTSWRRRTGCPRCWRQPANRTSRKAAEGHEGRREDLQESTWTATTSGRSSKGEVAEGPRHEFFYFSDNADLMAVRYNAWKVSFKTIEGNLFTGNEDIDQRSAGDQPASGPGERFQEQSMMYARWWGEKLWTMVPAVGIVGQFLQTFKDYPPSQRGGTLSIERALDMVQSGASGGGK
jgi:arylsulfatase A-like enzyme